MYVFSVIVLFSDSEKKSKKKKKLSFRKNLFKESVQKNQRIRHRERRKPLMMPDSRSFEPILLTIRLTDSQSASLNEKQLIFG